MSSEESFLLGFFAVFAGFILLSIVIAIIFYLLYALGMYGIAKKSDKSDLAFLAWIPIAQIFLLPLIVENDVHEEVRGKFTLIFAITFVGSFVLSWIFTPLGFLYLVVFIYGFYFLAARYSENAMIHTVIAAVTLGASISISLFRFRNREPIVQS